VDGTVFVKVLLMVTVECAGQPKRKQGWR